SAIARLGIKRLDDFHHVLPWQNLLHAGEENLFSGLTALSAELKWFTEFGHLNRGDMLTSEQHRCHNEKKKFQRRV
ncbi:hypothetical protein KQ917_28705, partial [Klebsiella pneumoniae]|nr:hypothetical protein [Klebsiella pneumoniae]